MRSFLKRVGVTKSGEDYISSSQVFKTTNYNSDVGYG